MRARKRKAGKNGKTAKAPIRPIFGSVGAQGAGAPPGTPEYIGHREPTDAVFSLIRYDAESWSAETPDTAQATTDGFDPAKVNWINVNGLADQEAIKYLGAFFSLDPLTVEDILNAEHRPKMEDFGRYLIVITKMLTRRDDGSVEYEQVSCVLTEHAVLTFQETPGDCFGPVRERIKSAGGRLRARGSDYLFYALLDVIGDNYFSILEGIGVQLEELEEASVSSKEAPTFMASLQASKGELNHIRRILWPVRETTLTLLHSESPLIGRELLPYLRDLQENTVQVIEALESYRETASGIQEIYLSSISNRMNQVMKVLTIISTIFIPLTFIVGVYGMNFRYMPELEQTWGYPAVLGAMALVAIGMIVYFKRKKWL
jgi:magnesium transporter